MENIKLDLQERLAEIELDTEELDRGMRALFEVDELRNHLLAEIIFYSVALSAVTNQEFSIQDLSDLSLVFLKETADSFIGKELLEIYKNAFNKEADRKLNSFAYGLEKESVQVEELLEELANESSNFEEILNKLNNN